MKIEKLIEILDKEEKRMAVQTAETLFGAWCNVINTGGGI
jgi:hypothetical protein